MEAKLPSTSRVLPKPTTGEPSTTLLTVRDNSSLRRSLLCWLASRSWKTVPSGLRTNAMVTTTRRPAVMATGAARPLRICRSTRPTTPSAREAHSPRLSE